ncbi:MAG: carbohydrate-binding protein [Gemmiger sp.]|nr:carbohydrate-binding protein [Gemmiger sp.]
METIQLSVLDAAGQPRLAGGPAGHVSLTYTAAYQPGDRIALTVSAPGQYCVIQLEDTMPPALVYLQKQAVYFTIPFGEQAIVYSPKSFVGALHVLRARFATPAEVAARQNLAFNPYDQHGDTGFYPHASANVETRGESVFAARNAIDGVFENTSHGQYPYQSWGINRDPAAALTLAFGRTVCLDELRLTLRGDYPHDNYWVRAEVEFSGGETMTLPLTNSLEPQCFPLATPIRAQWLVLKELKQAEGPSPFPALTQLEAYGVNEQA